MNQELVPADQQLSDEEYNSIKISLQNEQIDYEYEYEYKYDLVDEKIPDEEREYQKVKDLPNPIDSQTALAQIEEIIIQIQQLCQVDRDNSIEILVYNNWNIEQIRKDFHKNKETYLLEQKQQEKCFYRKMISYPKHDDIYKLCNQCQQEQYQIRLGCLHSCCYECLKNKINVFLEQGSIKISCLNEYCKYKLPFSMINKLMDDKTKVQNCLLKEFGLRAPFYMYCSLCDTFYTNSIKAHQKLYVNAEVNIVSSVKQKIIFLYLVKWGKIGYFQNIILQKKLKTNTENLSKHKFIQGFEQNYQKYQKNLCEFSKNSQLYNSLLQVYIELRKCFQLIKWATCFNYHKISNPPRLEFQINELQMILRNLYVDTARQANNILKSSLKYEGNIEDIEVLKTLQALLIKARIELRKKF